MSSEQTPPSPTLSSVLVVRRDRTENIESDDLADVRALLDGAFDGEFSDDDWRHSVGGHHVRGLVDGRLVAHASVVPRTIWCGETPYRTGYVEAVAVDAAHRHRGYGAWVMREVERVIVERYELGALSTTEAARPLYVRMGWQTWRGPSFVQSSAGRLATPEDDGGIMVLTVASGIDLAEPITCEWREGDVW